ncbi:ORF6N domain-containing protein [Pseudomonas aeruginosa]|uniref:ORF6N domain-containing protein n=1 Tax=Pseudomonas aeruginosa TaxID=287 RepID=UPI00071BB973|nr:ORF6N domain-containing protein [Pseudomonas aeruginosa]
MPEMKKPQVLAHPGLRGNVEIYEETNVMHDHSTDVADVSPETVPAMVYAGHPVVTTALLARLYGAEAKHIQNNYARNNARFESGKHFFKVEGADLADLKNKPSLRGFVGVKAKSLILWTARGAARHAKMLETNEAWDVFEKLEDCYFGKFESARQVPAPANQTLLGTTIGTDGFHCLAAVLDGKVRHLPSAIRRGAKNHIWSQVHKAFSVVTAEDIPADQLDSARYFIAAYALEGEWLPKEEKKPGTFVLDEYQAQFVHSLIHYTHWVCCRWDQGIGAAVKALNPKFHAKTWEFFRDLRVCAEVLESAAPELVAHFRSRGALRPHDCIATGHPVGHPAD